MSIADLSSVDLELACDGYLSGLDGRLRYVPGLNRIAGEMAMRDIQVRWGTPVLGKPACTYVWSHEIVLATWLFDLPGEIIRDVWLHELGHCMVGGSCERAREWQEAWLTRQPGSSMLA
jgi:hypothetical protein